MPYPNHALVAFGGHIPGHSSAHDEIWQCGVRVSGPHVGSLSTWLEDPAGYLAEITDPLAAWFADADSVMRGDSTLDWVKVNNISPDGTYADTADSFTHDYSPGVAGGSAAGPMPPLLTVCFSWVTAARRGLAHQGRIYPPVWVPAQAHDEVSESNRTSYATSGSQLLLLLQNGLGDNPAHPMVVSKVGSGYAHEITACRVGSIIDVQRRRKSALREVYTQVGP